MKRLFHYDDDRGIWLSALMVVIGLVLVIWPGHVMTSALRILGIALLLGGGILIWSWYKGRERGESIVTLFEGGILAVIGLFVLGLPKLLVSIVPFAVGALVLINGIINLRQALDQRKHHYDRWFVSLVMAILTIVLGGLIMLNPFSTMEILVFAIGVVILYNGASNLLIELGSRKSRQ
ncbi:MAG: DUF308 domain-containing protein [Clostridia bacterium]|nr:DUF308 domain-containing protein [Clostridia bacterium]